MRCIACNRILTDNELLIDDELCLHCMSISNEARVELEFGIHDSTQLTAREKKLSRRKRNKGGINE